MPSQFTDKALAEELPDWGVLVLESHHSPQFTMEWRRHRFLKVVYVLNGSGEFHFRNRKHSFSAGDVVVVPPRIDNRIEDDPASASSLYVCCIATSLLRFDDNLLGRLKPQCIKRDGHFANRVSSLMRRMVHEQSRADRFSAVSMAADALRLVQVVLRRKRTKTRSANDGNTTSHQKAIRQREAVAHYADSLSSEFFEATTIDAAAASLGMPRRTFTKLFAAETGTTWLRRIRELAIEHAKARLRNSELPIASVAFECGFNDLSTFYRQFKSQVGVSPAAYREKPS